MMATERDPKTGRQNGNPPGGGIVCRNCGASSDWQVHYTRRLPDNGGIRRVRICRQCNKRTNTVEHESFH